jgi:hypothetical protein
MVGALVMWLIVKSYFSGDDSTGPYLQRPPYLRPDYLNRDCISGCNAIHDLPKGAHPIFRLYRQRSLAEVCAGGV